MNHLFYGLKYLANYYISGKTSPLICGLVLHNQCNLRCRHCNITDRQTAPMTFGEAMEIIDTFYSEGGRCLYLEGGEPFLWKDDKHTIEDIINYSRIKGYFAVFIYTNGTCTLESAANTIFVSVDGLKSTHDALRGKSFEKIIGNIRKSSHPSIFINYTINSMNKMDVSAFCEFADKIPQIRGTFFYFHTPYYGYDDLYLEPSVKTEILKTLVQLKKKYRILNSVAGLKAAIRNDWKKNLDFCKVYEDGKFYTCCRENDNGSVCTDCGYLSYAEIDQTMKLNPGAIANALKYF